MQKETELSCKLRRQKKDPYYVEELARACIISI